MENTTTESGKGYGTPVTEKQNTYDMIVFCHLRWQFVYQRPQHIISRMAETMKILFVEEPIGFTDGEKGAAELMVVSPTLHILQPKVDHIEEIAGVLTSYLKDVQVIPIGWFYSAAFSPLLSALNFDTVIYDCMDELTLFKGAPQQLMDQEKYLIASADIVFTGGKSLYESKAGLHDNVFCFPSSVDEDHFAAALGNIDVPDEIASLPTPVVGYFGVIDERIDLDMIAETARLNPQVSFVIIGPLAKISEADLPLAQNIHYTGMKSYSDLPALIKGFDIAMMPFALNDATKYISPTKTLEYMAAAKPIISTRITDVLRDYSDCILFADDASEFSQHIDTLLTEADKLSTISKYREVLDATSWNATTSKMKTIINQYIQ